MNKKSRNRNRRKRNSRRTRRKRGGQNSSPTAPPSFKTKLMLGLAKNTLKGSTYLGEKATNYIAKQAIKKSGLADERQKQLYDTFTYGTKNVRQGINRGADYVTDINNINRAKQFIDIQNNTNKKKGFTV
jgi:hypothetical protein